MGNGDVKGKWRVNFFLFFLTGSQTVLLPWTPLVLQATGISNSGVGSVMSVVTLSSSVGVVLCLAGMGRSTYSGGVRRLLLLALVMTSTLLQVTAVMLLPHTAYINPSPCGKAPPLNPTPTSDGQLSVNNTQLSPSSFMPQPTLGDTNAKAPTPVLSESPASTARSTIPITTSSSTTTSTTTTTTSTISLQNRTFTGAQIPSQYVNESSQNNTLANGETSMQTDGLPQGSSISSGDIARTTYVPYTVQLTTETATKKPIGNSNDEQGGNNNEYESKDDDDDDDDGDYDEDYHDADHGDEDYEESFLLHQQRYPTNSKKFHSTNEDYSEKIANLYPVKYTKQKPKYDSENLSEVYSFLKPQTSQLEPPYHGRPAPSTNKQSSSDLSFFRGLWDSKEEPQNPEDHIGKNSLSGLQNLRLQNQRKKTKNHQQKFGKIQRSEGKNSQSEDSFPNKWREMAWKRSHNRHVRSVIDPRSHPLKDSPKDSRPNITTIGQRHARKRLVVRDLLGYELTNPIALQIAVSLLLIIGALVGAGVEASVAQFWHCYAHGYDEDGVSHDIIQRTITHTFHLSVYAAHKSWSKVTSGAWILGGAFTVTLACLMGIDIGLYSGLGAIHLAVGMCALCALLVVPVPYGTLEPPKTRRPLSLYLDDEVLREGVRRLAFHIWVGVMGGLASLSLIFTLFLMQEITYSEGSTMAGQMGLLTVTLVAEGLTLNGQRWIISRLGLQGTMGVASLSLTTHFSVMWACGRNMTLVVLSHACLGSSLALLWVAVRYNALLLATINDQEREAWASWWCWRVGVGIGAALWGWSVDSVGGRVTFLLMRATLLAVTVTLTVVATAVFSRRHWRTRRRVYHTLDLNMADDDEDDDDEDEAAEDDWLVKRAKKEGLSL